MKEIKITLLPEGHPDSVGYITKALKAIKENPKSHGFNEKEVRRLKKIEKEFNHNVKFPKVFQQAAGIQKKMSIAIDGMGSILGKCATKLKHVSAKGWYISPHVIYHYYIDELAEKVKKNNVDAFEKEIIENNRDLQSVKSIFENCKKNFENRRKLFDEIYALYGQGLYTSVISLCYSQADGMCNDIWGIGFFDKTIDENKKHKIKLYNELDKNDLGISSYFTHQLGYPDNEMTMWCKHSYFDDIDIKRSSFNRHLIIHGHSTEFGTEINALRSILLLDFINYFVNLHKDE